MGTHPTRVLCRPAPRELAHADYLNAAHCKRVHIHSVRPLVITRLHLWCPFIELDLRKAA